MRSHKGLEELISVAADRIKEMEESPDPAAARVETLYWQLNKERLEVQLEDWQRGKPSIDGYGCLTRLFRSMGFSQTYGTVSSQYVTPATYGQYKEICDRMGFPADKCCDKVVSQLAMREIDALPIPDVILADSHGCDNDHKYYSRSYGDLFGIPVFFVDVPLNEEDHPTLASLEYVADQLGEFIEWAEKKIPGIKYDQDALIEAQELDAIGESYVRDMYQLVRHVPCPISPLDALTGFIHLEASRYPNMRKAVEYFRVLRDEMGERAASGKGPYPEERLRLMWSGKSYPHQVLNPSRLLLERRVALPQVLLGQIPHLIGLRGPGLCVVSEYGVRLTPLQEEADNISNSCWGGPGKRWVNGTLDIARDIGAHGIIYFNLVGCTPGRGMGTVVADRAEMELGIPTIEIEGRYLEDDFLSQERFEEILSTFIDKCFDRAGKPRQ